MTETTSKPTIKPWEPTIAPCGSVTLPLSSGEWDLIIEPNGMMALLCNVPNMQDGSVTRHAVYLGEVEEDPVDLLEAINLARTGGKTNRAPN